MLLSRYLLPSVNCSSRQILLLSHMRGYTSLISHIIGGNEKVTGYFELHRSYRGYWDGVRARILLSKLMRHTIDTPYYFDKLLHNGLCISDSYLKSRRSPLILISIRNPVGAIDSLVSFGNKMHEGEELRWLADPYMALKYYILRLGFIEDFARRTNIAFKFFIADDFVENPEVTLKEIWDYIGIDGDCSGRYERKDITGDPYRGDSSEYIFSEEIIPVSERIRVPGNIPECVYEVAEYYFDRVSKLLFERSMDNVEKNILESS